MKKILLLLALCMFTKIYAQNLQLHYDFGKDRHYLTSTIETFKPDEYGSTYFFVDFDYNYTGNHSLSLAYWEISRYVNVYKNLSATLQYNDGVTSVPVQDLGNIAVTLNQTWLAGVSYPIDLGFVTLNTDLLYRKTYKSHGTDGQVTVTWFVPYFNGKLQFDGFVDVWSQDKSLRAGNGTSDKKEIVFLTEPQIWYNIDKHVSIGSEVEISNNFLPYLTQVRVNPTLAVKWNF